MTHVPRSSDLMASGLMASDLIADSSGDGLPAGARAVARRLKRPSLAPSLVSAVAMLLDWLALTLGLWFAFYAAVASVEPAQAAAHVALEASIVVLVAWTLRLYRLAALRHFWRGAALLIAVGLSLAALGGASVLSTLAVAALVLPARALGAALAAVTLDFGLTERRAVLIGGGARAEHVMAALAEAPDNDIRVIGIFDDRDDDRSPPLVLGVPKLGGVGTLVSFARAAEIDMVIVTLPLEADARIRQLLREVEILPVDVRLSDFSADPTFRRRSGQLGQAEDSLIAVMSRPIRGGAQALKRLIDVVGALVALALLAPLLALTALAIRLDSPGPILFRQLRHGYNHRPIEVWKFRSMFAASCDPAARQVVTRGDPRVTRVGRVIRRWSIDELPQLVNVLRGELSLVGPRPHALAAVSSRQEVFEAIVTGYAARHRGRPGITGWAQVLGWRGEIDDPEALRRRVEHDLAYIENWSVWLDLYVLALTPLRLLDTRRAY